MTTSDAVDQCGRPIDLAWWNEQVERLAARPLDPPALRSVLTVFPTSSGDFALLTTLFHHIKSLNPQCVITVGLKAANVAMARCCPLVDHVFALTDEQLAAHERRTLVPSLAGQADAVLDLVRQEVSDLLRDDVTFLQAFWLVAGAPPPPRDAGPVLLTPPEPPGGDGLDALRQWVGTKAAARVAGQAAVVWARALADLILHPRFRDTGVKIARRRARGLLSAAWTMAGVTANQPNFRGVILSAASWALNIMPPDFAMRLVRLLRDDGWTVFTNTADPSTAFRGTLPLPCSHPEFLQLRATGLRFVGWRSGLCDIAAAAHDIPMCVFYPASADWCDRLIETFGFDSMGIRATCMDVRIDQFNDAVAASMLRFLRVGRGR